jgi:hypothetical protein
MTAPRPFTTTKPPPIESLGRHYFLPIMSPLLVTTRVPQPGPNQDQTNAFLRIQSGGGVQRNDGYLWDVTLILHSYAPNDDEVAAEDNLATATAWGANAQGTTITLNNGTEFYVTFSKATGLATRQGDPMVDLVRYRSMVMWRVPGLPL